MRQTQTDSQTDRQTERERGRQTERDRERETERQREQKTKIIFFLKEKISLGKIFMKCVMVY